MQTTVPQLTFKFLTLGILTITAITPAFAQSNRETIQEQREERVEQRCELVESRVELITTRYDNNKERHVNRYNGIKNRTKSLVERLEEQDQDTSDLEAILAKLDTEIKTFAELYTEFVNSLREAQAIACGDSDGEYADQISESRQKLLEVKQQSLKIRNIIQSELRPEIKELRDQLKKDSQK